MEMVCIVCPNGCRLDVEQRDGRVFVVGNKCKRGADFATAELTNPMRSVTSLVKTTVRGYPVISVKTDGEIPKSKIFQLMKLCDEITVSQPLPIGSVVASGVLGTDVNLVTTTNMEIANE